MAYFQKPKDNRLSRYDHLIVHCTATKANMNEVDAAWVDRVHREVRGWRGCGYHAIITRTGEVQLRDNGYPTRHVTEQGAHVGDCGTGWNRRSFGVSLAGGVDIKILITSRKTTSTKISLKLWSVSSRIFLIHILTLKHWRLWDTEI
ncbi:MAG: hypothetical protein GY749_24235 [Desulfobacteraceae bacterium]|nr:hypothetical protein [Desulfobacteraceae bacterium]